MSAVERARGSLRAQGMVPDVEASRHREAFGRTRQEGADFHPSRFAAYLVAMNGDPRKPEDAAARDGIDETRNLNNQKEN